eukprot:IDg22686t1
MVSTSIMCEHCDRMFESPVALGRHEQALRSLVEGYSISAARSAFSAQEITHQYNSVRQLSADCSCTKNFTSQFPAARSFESYVNKARNSFVNAEGWRRTLIETAAGLNRTGVFRSVLDIIRHEVALSGGPSCVIPPTPRTWNGKVVRSCPVDSESLLSYYSARTTQIPIIAIDIYADSTTLARSGAQSACLLRCRIVNVRGRSVDWHDFGIAPHMLSIPALSNSKMAEQRVLLWHRFLFLALKDATVASRVRFAVHGTIHLLRPHGEPPELRDPANDDDVYRAQMSRTRVRERHVFNTVSRQLIVSRSTQTQSGLEPVHTRDEITFAKRYLRRVSATHIPPALAAVHRLGSEPFQLCRCIAFDKLHCVDLGVGRLLPDFAFVAFASPQYNLASYRIHANMTRAIRRNIIPFLWPVLLGLRPQKRPDDDAVLHAALLLNKFQELWRGVNMAEATGIRTDDDLDEIQRIAFEAGATISHALQLRISTKLHRLMHHASNHIRLFGCTRNGDTDANETLHKQTKAAYNATNKQVDGLASQLLRVSFRNSNGSDPAHSVSSNCDVQLQANPHSPFDMPAIIAQLPDLVDNVSNDNALPAALAMTHAASYQKVWTLVHSIRFSEHLTWKSDQNSVLSVTAYAGENIRGTGRQFDAVQYRKGDSVYKGIIHMILQYAKKCRRAKVIVIRRLRSVQPHPHNKRPVNEFGHDRLAYCMRTDTAGDIVLDCVSSQSLYRILPVLRDMHDVSLRFSISHRVCDIPDTVDERMSARFFDVCGVERTALPGKIRPSRRDEKKRQHCHGLVTIGPWTGEQTTEDRHTVHGCPWTRADQ